MTSNLRIITGDDENPIYGEHKTFNRYIVADTSYCEPYTRGPADARMAKCRCTWEDGPFSTEADACAALRAHLTEGEARGES